MAKYKMTIDLNILNHLGINLYSNVPAVLSEVVANAWDADATEVKIFLQPSEEKIIIEDDGHGMNLLDLNNKYLNIGYAKRENGEEVTPKYGRLVMGRKGIGKLSLFSIAKKIDVYSSKDGELNGLRLDSDKIQKHIKARNNVYNPEEILVNGITKETFGTRIILTGTKKNIANTEHSLKKRLSRRFSVIGETNNFSVIINGTPIKVEDRNYFHKIQYLWYYGDESQKYETMASNVEKVEKRPNVLDGGFKVSGWLGLVKESTMLTDDNENLNKIVLLMRGKISKEDMIEEFREGGLYIKYLFGEITADFLDDSKKPDIATSSRQDIVEEDSRYESLKDFLQNELKHLQRKRKEFKNEEGEKEALKIEPIEEWYKSLRGDTKKKAKSLFGKINQITVDEEHKKQLFQHGILAFESFRYKDALSSLEGISINNLDDFLKIFKEFDEIEATLYYKITKERLDIIGKLKCKVLLENALEKVLQSFLSEHLWLLDPSWDRATENVIVEKQVSAEFDKIDADLTEEEKKGRFDIKYKKPSGKHVIIELKRSSVKTDVNTLLSQVERYKNTLDKFLRVRGEKNPIIEVICLVGKPLKGWDDTRKEERDRKQMDAADTRLITYQELIEGSYNSYKEYIDANQKAGKLMKLIHDIGESSI